MKLFKRDNKDLAIDYLVEENRKLRHLCAEKDAYFLESISDGLRHGSKLAARHMADRKKYLHGK